ncbi:coniferyl aldehyde dehydrogenase [Kangiella koreensis]|uniref:Aldehyde dehydrogenase n=1 Tax=Kangiella koreensis (strain DSM 16069 / JCM 12317 / KCTC 12182 / SW-125) TaxID=523791 RepID=C7R7W1_KANKD|nr:coniferyl aldehyde dehydrogenase [Kangiella koreensis]ACV27644.1 Aldehyde Dehydrogenase [Kangiella koreensis DSM 16069]
MEQVFSHFKQLAFEQSYPAIQERRRVLKQLKKMLLKHEQSIIEAIDKDFSYREPFETQIAEIFPSIKAIQHAYNNITSWIQPEKRKVSIWFKPASASVMFQPLGVVGIIVPWNYPLYLAIGPIVAAIAAGNRVMVKMSEFTPSFSQLFAELCDKYIAKGWISVVNGDAEVAANFAALPFDHILFTGSTDIGKKVMAAASKNLTPVTLELGGKSPTIIDEGYPLEKAVEKLLFGKLLNSGQTCLAPDYLFVHQSHQEEFVNTCKSVANRLYPDWKRSNYTAMINNKQWERHQALLDDAKEKGADFVPLFCNSETTGRKQPPHIVLGATDDMLIMQQEIFGPSLPVFFFDSFDEIIKSIKQRPRPLALYLLSNDKNHFHRLMTETHSGGVTVNDTILHVSQENLPFGGIGPSGMGHYHGVEGFKTFSHAKSIFKQSRFASSKLIYPPYGKLSKLLYRLMRGR